MNIIAAIMVYPYGVKERGYSYEYYNIYLPLKELAQHISLFDYKTICEREGREGMNAAFLNLIAKNKPQAIVVVPFEDEFDPKTIVAGSKLCPTFAYLQDDIWRVEHSRFWAQHYTYVISTDPNGEAKFRAAGFNNVIYSPRGYNHHLYTPGRQVERDLGVTFVGGYAPYRGWMVESLRKAGISVQTYGSGWPAANRHTPIRTILRRRLRQAGLAIPLSPDGHVSQERMVDIFRRSKINLNFSNGICWDIRYLASSPLAVADTLRSKKIRDGIKGRHFEINGCGGFQLTYYAEGLEKVYDIGKEIAIYVDADELVDKVNYYLAHDAEREEIATSGLARTQREHAISRRLADVFVRAGLILPRPAMQLPARSGQLE